jgi:uncharacterized protein
MSEESREMIRRGYEAYSRGDLEAAMEFFDERVELRPPASSIDPEPRFGVDGVRHYMAPDLFEYQSAEPAEMIERENRILVVARIRARGRGSGVELDDVAFHLWTIEDGLVVRFEVMLDRDEAMARLRGD